MNYYLSKYLGKYRLKAEIDKSANDFCRDVNGNLDNPYDIWIQCKNDIRIYHYGKDILEVYIPHIIKGKNIIKTIYRNFINKSNTETVIKEKQLGDKIVKVENVIIINLDLFNKEIRNNDFITYYSESSEEVIFRIKDRKIGMIIDLLQPITSGANISPFSPKNLPKNKFNYTQAQIKEYEEIIEQIPKEDKLVISKINNNFLKDFLVKKQRLDLTSIKKEMKLEGYKLKDYIYYKGYEREYLDYLKKEIKKYEYI